MDMKTQHMKYFKSINGYFRVPSIGEYNYSGKRLHVLLSMYLNVYEHPNFPKGAR